MKTTLTVLLLASGFSAYAGHNHKLVQRSLQRDPTNPIGQTILKNNRLVLPDREEPLMRFMRTHIKEPVSEGCSTIAGMSPPVILLFFWYMYFNHGELK